MSVYLSSHLELPYLDTTVVEEFAQIVVKSKDGQEILINHLFLLGWSSLPKDLLQDAFTHNQDNLIISTNCSHDSIEKLRDFIMKGVLPCSEIDIINDKLPKEINSAFQSFGIHLKVVVNSFIIKKENGINQGKYWNWNANVEQSEYNYDDFPSSTSNFPNIYEGEIHPNPGTNKRKRSTTSSNPRRCGECEGCMRYDCGKFCFIFWKFHICTVGELKDSTLHRVCVVKPP